VVEDDWTRGGVAQGFADGPRDLERYPLALIRVFPPNECGLEVMRPISVNGRQSFS
jgi:hypothetical protein